MKYFDSSFLDFFKELASNNHKEWMDENRSRYIHSVKEPFKKLVSDAIIELSKIDQDIGRLETKNAIFRINRDIRFAKDKTPYKTQVSAVISATGKKPMTLPGVYIQMGPEDLRIYGGIYKVDTPTLHSIRTEIIDHPKKFTSLIQSPIFKNYYGEVLGEKNKRIHKDFVSQAETIPLLYNKGFYFFRKYPAKDILKNNLMDKIVEGYLAGRELSLFLAKPMRL